MYYVLTDAAVVYVDGFFLWNCYDIMEVFCPHQKKKYMKKSEKERKITKINNEIHFKQRKKNKPTKKL